jgi:hypothetical protein
VLGANGNEVLAFVAIEMRRALEREIDRLGCTDVHTSSFDRN